MKKIVLIFLLTVNSLFAQYDVFGQYQNPFSYFNSVLAVPSIYNARATLFFKRVTDDGITLTDNQKTFYNNLFANLIDSGLIHASDPQYDSLEVFYWFAVSDTAVTVDSNLVNLNLLQDNYNAIHYGTVTYTDSGVVGNGSDGYLTTQFNPTADSSICKKNSIGAGVYSKKEVNEDKELFGSVESAPYLYFKTVNNKLWGAFNSSDEFSPTIVGNIGAFVATRTTSAGGEIYQNGTSVGTYNVNSTTKNNSVLYFLSAVRGVQRFSAKLFSSAFIGSGLSSTKSRALSNIINSNLALFNYNVY